MAKHGKLSLRDFLRLAGAAGGAVSLGAVPILKPTARPRRRAQANTINVLTVGDPWDLALQNVTDQFTEMTGIAVNIESLGYPALQARLVNAFLTQTSDADVIGVDQMWYSQYADNGWIRSLDEFIAADSDTDLGDFLPQALYSSSTWRDHIWTLPVAAYAQGIMYRTDVFEAAGLDPLPNTVADAGDWTWEDYFAIVEQLNGMEMDGTTFYGTTLIGQQPVPVVHMYTQLSASYGTRWFTQFPEAPWDFTPTINSEQNVAAMNAWKRLYAAAPPECINYPWFDAGTRFSGPSDIALMYHWTPYFYLINNDGYLTGTPSTIVDKVAYGVLPTLEAGGDQTVSLGGWSLGMPSTAGMQDEAWQFIKYATSFEGQKAMGQVDVAGNQFADFSRLSLYEDAELREIYPFLDTQLEMMRLGNGKVVRPPVPIYTSLEGVYGLHINQVMADQITPEAALESVDTLFTNILSGNYYLPYNLDSFDDTLENTIALIERLSS